MIRVRKPSPGTVIALCAVVLALVGTATGATLITGRQVANNSLTGKDIKDRSLQAKELTTRARNSLKTRYVNPDWGVIYRNTIGSAVAELRGGPYVGDAVRPPFGIGSLGIQTSDAATSGSPPAEKVAFGNEVDFAGDSVNALTQLGFRVFTTAENVAPGAPNPNITLEIDPGLDAEGTDDYTSMVWTPPGPTEPNAWSGYIDATTSGNWFLTGAEGTATGCSQETRCSLADLKTALADGGESATIRTLAVAKGRDSTFAGAVDGLRVNGTVYDFEPLGVFAVPAS